jgi:hypothetical protein
MGNKAQKARASVRSFKTIAGALILRGYYKPTGESGKALKLALCTINPEIYGLMNDPHQVELDGLVYVCERLPKGVEECTRLTLSGVELNGVFPPIFPAKRRRTSYRVSEREMCFEITKGLSEVYDILTHLTFFYIEAEKIKNRGYIEGAPTQEWKQLEETIRNKGFVQSFEQEIWNLSKILGRTYWDTKKAYDRLEQSKGFSNSLFSIVYWLGRRMAEAEKNKDNDHIVLFSPSLTLDHHQYGEHWAAKIKKILEEKNLQERPLHIISANLHSVLNLLYGYGVENGMDNGHGKDIYAMAHFLKDKIDIVKSYAANHGCIPIEDESGSGIDCQLIDTTKLDFSQIHPQVMLEKNCIENEKPLILVMDYAFGEQAFEVMDELLKSTKNWKMNVHSISIMGKAGILEGEKGDIMLPTSHIFEGITDTYLCPNELTEKDFPDDLLRVYRGPMVTVLGTSLQNCDMLMYFLESSWKAIGLEMEGGHYQKAIQSAILRGHIRENIGLRYAYYASDNPVKSGETLASGSMGEGGIKPTYFITQVILKKILSNG